MKALAASRHGVWIYANGGHCMPCPYGKKSWTSHKAFLTLQEVCGVVDQDRAEDAFGFAQDVLQGFFHVLLGIGESDDADGRGLPNVVEVEFGDGDVEFAAETIFEAADDLALVLEGVRVRETEFENEQAYRHIGREE
jgi:hypothetical protein